MANVLATFTSGLVVGSAAVYAFTAHFTEQSHVMNYKLQKAAAVLREASTGEKQALPSWKETKPDVMNKYEALSSRLSNNAIPQAKTEWNSTVSCVAKSIADIEVDTDKLATLLRKD